MNNLQKLYQSIFDARLINDSFDDFNNAMLDEDYQKKVFDAVSEREFFNQDFDTFKSAYTPDQTQDQNSSWFKTAKEWLLPSISELNEALSSGLSRADAYSPSQDIYSISSKSEAANMSDKELEVYIKAVNEAAKKGNLVELEKWSKSYQKSRDEGENIFMSTLSAIGEEGLDGFAQVMVQSMAGLTNKEILAIGGGSGLVAGGATGLATGGVGAIPAGAAAFFGTANTAAETMMTFNELLQEELNKRNLKFTPDNIRTVMSDDDARGAIKRKATLRGVAIGTVEGVSSLVGIKGAGAVTKATSKAGNIVSKTAGGATAATIEAVGGSAGEAAGMTVAGQEFNEQEIILEGIAGMGKAPLDLALGTVSTVKNSPKYYVNGVKVSEKSLNDYVGNATAEELAAVNIDIENDAVTKDRINDIRLDSAIESQLDTRVANVEDRAELLKLEKNLLKLGDKKTRSGQAEKKRIQSDIDNILKKYETAEVDASLEQAKQKVSEARLEKNISFAEKEGAKIGKKVNVLDNDAAAQEAYNQLLKEGKVKESKNVTGSDGFIVGDQIYINKEVASERGAISVGSHELLHGIIGDSFGKLDTDARAKLGKSFMNTLTRQQKRAVERRLKNSYGIEGDAVFQSEEMFTVFSDAIAKNEITFNEGVFSKIGNAIQEVLRKLSERGLISEDSFLFRKEFSNGRQAYNFLKEYNKNIKAGKLGERATAFAAVDQETTTTKASLTRISEKASEIQSKVDAIGQKATTKAEFDAGPNIEAYNYLIDGDGLTGLIKARLAKQGIDTEGEGANVNGVPMADYIEDVKAKLIPDVLGFNPEKETTSQGKFGLSGYINQRLNFRMGDVAKSAKKTVTGRSLDAPIDDSGRTAAELVEGETDPTLAKLEEENLGFLYVNSQNRSQETEEDKNVLKSRYRHKLKNIDGSNLVGETQVESVREGVRTTLRRLKADVASDKFLLNFENMVKKTMKNIVQRSIGSGVSYRQFVLNNFEAIIDFSTVQDLVAMERLVGKGKLKDGKKIFTVPIRRLTKQEDIQKAIDQGKLPVDAINKSEEGVFLSEKRMPTQEELQAFFFGVDMQEVLGYELGASTLGTRKDGLSRMIVTELSQDAMMETMQESDIMEELISANPDVAVQVMVNDVAVKINRAPGLKFSRTALTEQGKVGFDILMQEAKGLESSAFKAYVKKTPKKIVNEVIEAFKKRLWEVFIQSDKLITQAELDAVDKRFKTKKGKPIPLHRKYEVVVGDRLRSMLEDAGLGDAYIVEHPSETDNNQDVRVIDRATGKLALALEVKGDTARGVAVTLNYIDGKLVASKTKELEGKQIPIYGDEQQALQEGLNKLFDKIIKAAEAIKPGSVSETNQGNLSIEKEVIDQIKLDGLHLEAHDIKEEITFEQVVDPYRNKKGTKKATKDTVKISHAIELKGRGIIDISMDGDADGNFEATLKIEGLTKAKDIDVKVPLQGRLKFRSTKKGYTVSAIIEPQLAAYHLPDQKASFLVKDRNKNVKIKASKSKKLSVAQNITKASDQARTKAYFSKTKGASIFDFDETVGISENVIIATKEGVTKEIQSDQWPFVGEDLANQGYEFDFTDFNKVTKGKPGPLLPKMKNQIKKYGPDNVFILTARAPESAEAIHAWLKSEGVNIPLKNITGLGNSTGEAKAMWVLNKYANESYNDMYFVDDAITNVKAVQNIFDQLDIKGKSVQAKMKFSKTKKQSFDNILKRTVGIDQEIDPARAKIIGAKKGSKEFFIAPGADDFQGLMLRLAGKGAQGDSDVKFFKQVFFDPFNRAYRKLNSIQYNMMESYAQIRKEHKDVIKKLKKKIDNEFTNEDAIRIYLWDLQDLDVPGLTTTERKAIASKVANDADMVQYALKVRKSLQIEGDQYLAPTDTWTASSIKGDMYNSLNKVHRDGALEEWQENINELLDNEAQMAKLEAAMGADYVESLKDMLYRMRTGKNRPSGQNASTNKALNWLQGSVGAIMFFNMRSAVLQTISTVNFINHTDNNIFAFAKAIANAPQFAKDFKMLFNSPQLKVRRSGLQQDIQTADLADSLSRGGGAANALAYLLKIGFTPTQIADSFAIAFGGATFYRNRVSSLIKEGMTQDQAESQAMIDFQDITEESQQSSRPDRISKQQASPVGRLLLAFQNTPLQYNRIIKKAVTNIANKRGNIRDHLSRIAYYGAVQSLIFYSLQQALFAEDEPEEDQVPGSVKKQYKAGIKDGSINRFQYPSVSFYYADVKNKQKKESLANSMADGWLRGSGVKGAMVSTFKNVVKSFMKESDKGYKADYFNTFVEVLNLSPQIGSKARKIKRATDTYKYNKDVMAEIGAFDIDNPVYPMTTSLIEGTTNAPVHRIYTKLDNLKEAFNEDNTAMQRTFVALGWNQWQMGIDTYKDVREAKEKIKEEKKAKKKQCRRILKSGKRCSIRTTNKSQLCYHHD